MMHRRATRRVALRLATTMMVMVAGANANAAEIEGELHGHSDAFSAQGVAIAWGVSRGNSEDTTSIVLRIAADPRVFAAVAVDGVDPFTSERKPALEKKLLTTPVEVRIPRSRFADFPRTELRFFGAGADAAGAPRLTVYYLGVPDTTPEFNTESQLEGYLARRIGELDTVIKKP